MAWIPGRKNFVQGLSSDRLTENGVTPEDLGPDFGEEGLEDSHVVLV